MGTLAAYAGPEWDLTFFEIDPVILRVASNPHLFSYLTQCRGVVHVKMGDARISLAQAPDHAFDLLVVDAFNSDSIPIHLLTREAMQLYVNKIAPGGLILFQISNRYLDLEPVIANLAHFAGWSGFINRENSHLTNYKHSSHFDSTWTILAAQPERLSTLAQDARWKSLPSNPTISPWTDDYSNILAVVRHPWSFLPSDS